MRLFVLLSILLVATLATAQKRVLVTDKVDVKDSIRLRGKSVAEISRDSQFLSPTHFRLPTQKAVRDYVNTALGNVDVDSLVKAATASGFLTANTIPYVDGNGRLNSRGFEEFGSLGSSPSAPSNGFRFFADASGRPSWRRADGYVRTFDASTITADRVYTLQNISGILAMLEAGQNWTGVNTFAPTGSGGSGFTVQGTARFSMPVPVATDAQIGALTGNVLGGWMVSSTQNRPYFFNGSAYLGVMLGPQGGVASGQVSYGGTGGNLTSSNGLTYNGTSTLTVGVPGNGNFGQITFPSSQSGFSRNIQAPLTTNTLTVNLASSQLSLDQNGISLNTSQSGTFLRLEAGSHYASLVKIRSYSGNGYGGGFTGIGTGSPVSFLDVVPTYLYTGDIANSGYFFRVAAVNATNNTTPSSGTVPSASFNTFNGGGIISVGTNVTYTNFGTLSVLAPPSAGANSIITNPWSFWVATGNTLLGGDLRIGSGTWNSTAALEIISTKGFLGPRTTTANINTISSPPVNLRVFSTDNERQKIKRTNGWHDEAFYQDIKRDTSFIVVNGNLDLSGLTSTFQYRYHTVRVFTAVTAAAAGNNTITMPVPSSALLGVNIKIAAEDTSGDGDQSQLSFGTDGVDGYLYNGDGTYQSTFNVPFGFGVYLSVAWCEAKSAYRWVLQ